MNCELLRGSGDGSPRKDVDCGRSVRLFPGDSIPRPLVATASWLISPSWQVLNYDMCRMCYCRSQADGMTPKRSKYHYVALLALLRVLQGPTLLSS